MGVLQLAEPAARDCLGLQAQQRQEPTLEGALVQLDLEAKAEAADHVEQLLERHSLGVEQDLVAGIEDPQVAQHLALGGEKRGVTALARGQHLDVVGHLALEEALGVPAGQRQLAALGAVQQSARLGGGAVIRRRGRDRAHPQNIAIPVRRSANQTSKFGMP